MSLTRKELRVMANETHAATHLLSGDSENPRVLAACGRKFKTIDLSVKCSFIYSPSCRSCQKALRKKRLEAAVPIRWPRKLLALAFLLALGTNARSADWKITSSPGKIGVVTKATYPDPKLTPGAVDSHVTVAQLCTPGYTAKIRFVSARTKIEVLRRYGLDYNANRAQYEVDHFISLELGGLNDLSNLWPQRWKPEPGAREKDVVETWLHRQICGGGWHLADSCGIYPPHRDDAEACGTIVARKNTGPHDRVTIKQAQRAIRLDWYAVYKTIPPKKR